MPDRGRFTTNASVELDARGGNYLTLMAKGTWGGGKLAAQAGFLAETGGAAWHWVDIPDAFLTADGCVTFAISAYELRVTFSGGTAQSVDWAVA